jgi:hypothetical protein
MAEGKTMSKETRRMRAPKTAVLLASMCALALAWAASPATASEGINSFSVTSSTSQAGGHPDLGMSFSLESPGEPEAAQDVIVNTPEGLFGNPNATIQCTSVDFALTQCAPATQVGYAAIRAKYEGNPNYLLGTAPIFVLEPSEDEPALFAFVVPTLNIPISIPVAVRTGGDYGLRFTVASITQVTPLAGADITFWGFPAAKANDPQRFRKGSPGEPAGCIGAATPSCIGESTSAAIAVHPLIDNPSTCTGQALVATIDVRTYQDPEHLSHGETSYPETTGCFNTTFKPVLYANPTTGEADAASGLDVRLSARQPLGLTNTPSPIHSSRITFPEGFTINPDAADGQTSCPDALANFGTEGPAECPDSSKIGTFAITSPALDSPLEGAIYIGEPKPGNQYRLFMAADGFGIHAKVLGSFRPDPKTGQLTAYFDDLPQVPFDEFQVHLFAGDRGLVATGTNCRVYEVEGQFFPWNTALPDQRSVQLFSIDSGPNGGPCPGPTRPFNPRLFAGTSNPTAGAFSDFTLRLDRDDGDQFLGDLNFKMPPGFTGNLRGISYCPEASIAAAAEKLGREEQAAPSCPTSAQVGTTNVAAGPGSHPFHAVGRMYLAGPFKGAPLSLAAITPALAGPYDYGVVVVRVALHVDPLTAQVSAISDTVPSIIGGVPIRMRSIQVNINRPNFTINPTNCAPLSVDSQGVGDQGTVTDFSSYFHAVNCGALGFKPKMTIRQLGGHKATSRSKNPAMRFDLWTRPGDANLKQLSLTLPKAFAIDQRHLGNICSRTQLATEHCRGRQPIGTATTETPLLDQNLSGPAYAVSGFGKLPHVVFILGGQVTVMPEVESSSVEGGHLKTVVPVVPDVPIGHFRLDLTGGKEGYLINTRSLCASKAVVQIKYVAQNGKRRSQNVRAKTACGHSRAQRRHVR